MVLEYFYFSIMYFKFRIEGSSSSSGIGYSEITFESSGRNKVMFLRYRSYWISMPIFINDFIY